MSLTKRWAEKIGWFEDQQYPQSEIEYQEYLKYKNEKCNKIHKQNINIHIAKNKKESDSGKDS